MRLLGQFKLATGRKAQSGHGPASPQKLWAFLRLGQGQSLILLFQSAGPRLLACAAKWIALSLIFLPTQARCRMVPQPRQSGEFLEAN